MCAEKAFAELQRNWYFFGVPSKEWRKKGYIFLFEVELPCMIVLHEICNVLGAECMKKGNDVQFFQKVWWFCKIKIIVLNWSGWLLVPKCKLVEVKEHGWPCEKVRNYGQAKIKESRQMMAFLIWARVYKVYQNGTKIF